MLVSELIEKLTEFKKKHGNLPVVTATMEYYGHLTETEIALVKNVLPIISEDLSDEEIEEKGLPEALLIGYDLNDICGVV